MKGEYETNHSLLVSKLYTAVPTAEITERGVITPCMGTGNIKHYAGGSAATGRVSLTMQADRQEPDEKEYPSLQVGEGVLCGKAGILAT
jgi:hypothetical protein